jgi:YVTN family beta-propeller protein
VTIQARYGALLGTANLLVRDTTTLGNRVALANQPFGAAISVNDVAYVTQGQGSRLARADLPSQVFTSAVAVGSVPTDVTFNSTGTFAYATNQFNQDISIVDVANDTVIGTIPLTGDPFEVIVAPGDSILYVATNAYQVYGVRLATKAVITQFSIGSVSNGMVVRNDTLLYVSTVFAGTVVEWNLRTRSVSRVFPVGGTPQKIALSADGNTLYIANLAGYVQFWNLVTGAQDGANIMLPPGSAGYGIARRPTTGLLYVSTAYYASGSIYIIDPATRAIINAVVTNGSTRDIVFDSAGRGFVTNENGWVDFIK